jgi:hypothetical protein
VDAKLAGKTADQTRHDSRIKPNQCLMMIKIVESHRRKIDVEALEDYSLYSHSFTLPAQ